MGDQTSPFWQEALYHCSNKTLQPMYKHSAELSVALFPSVILNPDNSPLLKLCSEVNNSAGYDIENLLVTSCNKQNINLNKNATFQSVINTILTLHFVAKISLTYEIAFFYAPSRKKKFSSINTIHLQSIFQII